MNDWKSQLKEAYQVIRDKKKALKPDTSTKFDSEINFKGRAGYNDNGIPLSPKTIRQKNKNKSMYAARAKAKYWAAGSQLKNINDQINKVGTSVSDLNLFEDIKDKYEKYQNDFRDIKIIDL